MPRKAKEKDVELNNKIDEKKTAKTAKKTIATKKEQLLKKVLLLKLPQKEVLVLLKRILKKILKSQSPLKL